jgi:Phage capsid family
MSQPQGISLRPDPLGLRDAALTSIARTCLTIARSTRGRAVKSAWPEDRGAHALLTRAASAPATIATTPALTELSWSFVASLVPVSAAAALVARSLQLRFDSAAQLNVPGLTLPRADFVGEGLAIPVQQGLSSAGATVSPAKLAMILPLTNELVAHSNAEAMMRQLLLESVGPTLDAAMLSASAAVAGLRPAGILEGVAPLAASSAATPLDAMVADVAAIATAIAPAAGASTPLLIAAPAQAVALTLRSPRDLWPVLMSAALPPGTVIGIVPAAVASVVEAPMIEASSDAVLHMDDVGAPLVDIGGILARPLASMWQTDSMGLRFILPAAWGRRSASAVAWVQGTTW